MNIIESKNVDLLLSKNELVDLYDEQILSNKETSTTNEKILKQINGRLTTIETVSNNHDTRIYELEQNNNTVKLEELNKLNKSIADLYKKSENLKSSLTEIKNSHDELSNTVSSNTTTINNNVNKITRIDNSVNELKNTVNSHDERITALINKTNLLETVSNRHGIQIDDLTDKNRNLQTNVTSNTKEIVNINARLLGLENAGIKNLEYENAINEIRTNLSNNYYDKTIIDNKLSNLSAGENKNKEYEEAINKLKTDVQTHTNEISDIKTNVYTKVKSESLFVKKAGDTMSGKLINPLGFVGNLTGEADVADLAKRIKGDKLIFENGTEFWIREED